jgi:hypothetical protein
MSNFEVKSKLMDIHPQYTYDKNGNPVGVFISIEEWKEISGELQIEIPQWQKDALDIELQEIETNPDSLQKWEDIKRQLLS